MALVQCRECKKEISDSTKVCPSCGCTLKADLVKGLICIATVIMVLIALSIQLMVARSPMFSGPQMMSPDMMGSPFEMNMPSGQGGMNAPSGMSRQMLPGGSE